MQSGPRVSDAIGTAHAYAERTTRDIGSATTHGIRSGPRVALRSATKDTSGRSRPLAELLSGRDHAYQYGPGLACQCSWGSRMPMRSRPSYQCMPMRSEPCKTMRGLAVRDKRMPLRSGPCVQTDHASCVRDHASHCGPGRRIS